MEKMNNALSQCRVCPRQCGIDRTAGKTGFCRAPYLPKVALVSRHDWEEPPISGTKGSGTVFFSHCNLNCVFCQNHDIAEGTAKSTGAVRMSPEEILEAAVNLRSRGNIGVAFTYNEALVGYEFVRDTARLVHEAGMYNALVTNGMAEMPILLELLPYIDAMNIDLKAFRPELYKWLGGDLQTVMRFISRSAEDAHVELTTLIIPGKNDDLRDMEREAVWIAEIDPQIPLHITRYFPRRISGR